MKRLLLAAAVAVAVPTALAVPASAAPDGCANTPLGRTCATGEDGYVCMNPNFIPIVGFCVIRTS